MKGYKNLQKIWYVFFEKYFNMKNYVKDLRHYCQILIENSWNFTNFYLLIYVFIYLLAY